MLPPTTPDCGFQEEPNAATVTLHRECAACALHNSVNVFLPPPPPSPPPPPYTPNFMNLVVSDLGSMGFTMINSILSTCLPRCAGFTLLFSCMCHANGILFGVVELSLFTQCVFLIYIYIKYLYISWARGRSMGDTFHGRGDVPWATRRCSRCARGGDRVALVVVLVLVLALRSWWCSRCARGGDDTWLLLDLRAAG